MPLVINLSIMNRRNVAFMQHNIAEDSHPLMKPVDNYNRFAKSCSWILHNSTANTISLNEFPCATSSTHHLEMVSWKVLGKPSAWLITVMWLPPCHIIIFPSNWKAIFHHMEIFYMLGWLPELMALIFGAYEQQYRCVRPCGVLTVIEAGVLPIKAKWTHLST